MMFFTLRSFQRTRIATRRGGPGTGALGRPTANGEGFLLYWPGRLGAPDTAGDGDMTMTRAML